MSIGKNSIARAVNSTAPAKKETKPVQKKQDTTNLMVETDLIKFVKGFYLKEKASKELVASIKKNGIIEPLFVAATKDGKFYILDGAFRLDAAKTLKLKLVPVVLKATEDEAEARAIYKELKATAKKAEVLVRTEVKEVIVEKAQKKVEPKKETTRLVTELPVHLL